MNENDLMSRLVASKAIMDSPKFNQSRNSISGGLPPTSLQDFDVPQAKYNIPQEYLQEQQSAPLLSQIPSVDAIKNSKLPDEIKRLMIEHPIAQAQQQQATLSNDLVEKASRLMKREDSNYIPESAKNKQTTKVSSGIDYNMIQKMIEEAVEKALEKNGLLVESAEKTNEIFSFKVGKHIFEGKVTKIKKLS
jgi:hypothetical protein